MNYETYCKLKEKLAKVSRSRSCWDRGVALYAKEMVDELEEFKAYENVNDVESLIKEILSGAEDWEQYSRGGFGLISNYAIAERLYTKSRFKEWEKKLNKTGDTESLIDLEATALAQASDLIANAYILATSYGGN